ncbi:Tricorn protease OS=Streptomyces cyaneofuscatus OX=66883 GN=G3I52_33630 PE=3 SV=1 [Streptomyces cyaneofuscatus]
MTGRHRLGDGTSITVPMNAAWFDAYGWSVENHGVEPDVKALRTPLDWAEGRYAVLDDAVRPRPGPPGRPHPASDPALAYDTAPNLRRPPLPPRSG